MFRIACSPLRRSVARCALSLRVLALLVAVGPIAVSRPSCAQAVADPYTRARAYVEGHSREALATVEAEIRSATPARRRAIEGRLLSIVRSTAATRDGRGWACRMLRVVGTEPSAPSLTPLLADPTLAMDAAWALRSIPGPGVDTALRTALAGLRGRQKAVPIQVLGARGDRRSVGPVARLAGDPDPVVAEAALYALGHIGGAEALRALQAARVPVSLSQYRRDALLRCADSVLREGRMPQAAAAYRAVAADRGDAATRAAALRGLVLADPGRAASSLCAALEGPDLRLRSAAVSVLWRDATADLAVSVLRRFDGWPASLQALVLGAGSRPSVLPIARQVAGRADGPARAAAVRALGRFGAAADVPVLTAAADGHGPQKADARAALRALRGPGIDAALVRVAEAGAAGARTEAIGALADRNAAGAAPRLLALAGDSDPAVRVAALAALGQVAPQGDLPALVGILAGASDDSVREAAEEAAAAVARRATDREAAAGVIGRAIPGAAPAVQGALLRLLGAAPSAGAVAALRTAADGTDAAMADTAVKVLAEWPDGAALPDLERIARTGRTPLHRALALRGLVSLAVQPGARRPEEAAQLLGEALGMASSADEKKRVLAALMQVPHPASLRLAVSCLSDPELEAEAASTVVSLAMKLQASDGDAAFAAIRQIMEVCKSPEARQIAENSGIALGDMVNVAPQGTASSPDGLDKDGAAGDDQAAIDGNPETYWDEADNAKLYRLVVTFREPQSVAAISILGHSHENYAPRDFEVLADGKVIARVENARYTDNVLVVRVPETRCQTVELRITGAHGASPAIRELGIYRPVARKAEGFRVLVFSKTLGFRHSNIPLGVAAIKQMGAENGFAVDATEDSAVFAPANLARYKAVVFLSVTGDVLDDGQQTALKDYITNGGGFAAIHGALFGPSACEEQWAWYGELLCASFKNHSAVVPARVDVEDRVNPSTAHLPSQWQRTDEWYNYAANPRGQVRVLATVDESTYQGGTMGNDHPIAWCRRAGKGAVWYTAMGHTEESFAEPAFLAHVLGGIQQVAGVRPADFAPSAAPAAPR